MKKTYFLNKPAQEAFTSIDNLPQERMFESAEFTKEFISSSPPTFVIYMKPFFSMRSSWGKSNMTVVLEPLDNGTRINIEITRNWNYRFASVLCIILFIIYLLAARNAYVMWILPLLSVVFYYMANSERRKMLEWFETFMLLRDSFSSNENIDSD